MIIMLRKTERERERENKFEFNANEGGICVGFLMSELLMASARMILRMMMV